MLFESEQPNNYTQQTENWLDEESWMNIILLIQGITCGFFCNYLWRDAPNVLQPLSCSFVSHWSISLILVVFQSFSFWNVSHVLRFINFLAYSIVRWLGLFWWVSGRILISSIPDSVLFSLNGDGPFFSCYLSQKSFSYFKWKK